MPIIAITKITFNFSVMGIYHAHESSFISTIYVSDFSDMVVQYFSSSVHSTEEKDTEAGPIRTVQKKRLYTIKQRSARHNLLVRSFSIEDVRHTITSANEFIFENDEEYYGDIDDFSSIKIRRSDLKNIQKGINNLPCVIAIRRLFDEYNNKIVILGILLSIYENGMLPCAKELLDKCKSIEETHQDYVYSFRSQGNINKFTLKSTSKTEIYKTLHLFTSFRVLVNEVKTTMDDITIYL